MYIDEWVILDFYVAEKKKYDVCLEKWKQMFLLYGRRFHEVSIMLNIINLENS